MNIASLLTPEVVQGVITVLTPLVIAGVKFLVPRIKPFYLPLAAPLVGLLAGVVANYAGGTAVPLLQAAIAGGLGVWLREAADQLKKAVNNSPVN